VLRSLEKPGAESELRHHIKAAHYLKIALDITLDRGFALVQGHYACNSCKPLWNAWTASTFEGLTCPFGHAIKARFASEAAQGPVVPLAGQFDANWIRRGQAQHSFSCLAVEACSEHRQCAYPAADCIGLRGSSHVGTRHL